MNDNTLEPEIQPEPPKPFAGRHDVFAQMQQYLIDPSDRHALLIIGRDGMGKTSILQQFAYVLEDNVIPCYVSMSDMDFEDWLFALIEQTNQALAQSSFTISRLPQLAEKEGTLRDWFLQEYLPEVNKLIRSHRRVVWLMDDVEYLLDAMKNNRLPEDILAFLYAFLQANLQFGIVLTLDEDNEARVNELVPLVDVGIFQRLSPLSVDETADLMKQFGLTIEPDGIEHIHNLTDGYPRILQYMGEVLQPSRHMTISKVEVDAVVTSVYQQSHETYRNLWQNSLSQNERLVLTAISGLLYDDPLADLTTQRIEKWLLETDYPLDMTAVNAGIRGLEYRELVFGGMTNMRIRAGLFQRWLIEHARMDEVNPAVAKSNAVDEGVSISRNGILMIIGLAIAIVVVVAVFQQSNQTNVPDVQPTVTIEP